MKKNLILNLSVWIGAIAFYFLFRGEALGLNTLLFTLPALTALFALHPESRRSRSVLLLATGTVFCALMVVWNNTFFAKTVFWLSFFTLAGMVQQRELRFLFFGLLLAFGNFFKVPYRLIKNIGGENGLSLPLRPVLRYGKLIALPCVIVFVFLQIYLSANLKFAEMTFGLFDKFAGIFTLEYSFAGFFFFLLSLCLTGVLLLKSEPTFFPRVERNRPDTLNRKRKKVSKLFGLPKILALKNEYQAALILLSMLNGLLWIVNLSDLRYVWWGTEIMAPHELSLYVHEGTYLLIFSVLCAAGVLLWYFRGNINFLPENSPLKIAAYGWIVQNAVLALSVGARNWRYVSEYGLAHKRIGVFIFLLLLLAGLFFLFVKVRDTKSNFFLLRRNAWAIWTILVMFSAVNWDVMITKFNLSGYPNSTEIDYSYLDYGMTDKNLFVLLQDENYRKHWAGNLYNKQERFKNRTKRLTWKSWNYSDARNRRAIGQ